MIKIGYPEIERKDGKTTLKAFVINEVEGVNKWMWFSTDEENGKFFCPEVADAFLLPMILRAVKTHQNIIVESSMSEKLFYNLNDSVLYAVTKAYEAKYGNKTDNIVRVECDNLVSPNFNPNAVGTGCSLGVDSFAVLKHHLFSDDCPLSYKVTHLTLFNAGAFGSRDAEGARRSFEREIEQIKVFAKRINVSFVWVDSNVRSFFPELSFDWCHTFLNMGIVLSMQKLWKKYLYASGFSVDYFSFDIADSAHYEPFLLPHLSTESAELISASMNMNRSAKVDYISTDKIVQEKLNVCLKEQIINNPNIPESEKYRGQYLNCGRCKKCLRTLLQLDILGRTNDFRGIFDLEEWNKKKEQYIADVIHGRNSNYFMNDLYCSMIEHNYSIPQFSMRLAKKRILKDKIRRALKKIGL